MSFKWDPAKAQANLRKHGVDFADAVGVLEDPAAVTIDDDATGEKRFVSVGTDFIGRLLVVCWTRRGEDIRLISVRPATRAERRQYEEGE